MPGQRRISEKELGFHAKRKNLSQLEQRLIADLQECRAELQAAQVKPAPIVQEGVVLVVQRCANETIEVYAKGVRIKHLLVTRWLDNERSQLVKALGEPWAAPGDETPIEVERLDLHGKPMKRALPSAAGWTKVVVVSPEPVEAGNGSPNAHSRPAPAAKGNAPQRSAASHGQGQGKSQPAQRRENGSSRSPQSRPVQKPVPKTDR